MRFVQIQAIKGTRVLHAAPAETIVARKYRLESYDSIMHSTFIAQINVPWVERLAAAFTFTRLGLRLGIHAALPLADAGILVVLRRRFVLIEPNGEQRLVDVIHRGNKPAFRGVCAVPSGPVLYGEYLLNDERSSPIAVYRSANLLQGFTRIFEFQAGDIRHIHFIQWDPFESCLWMGTGDADNECRLYRSSDTGDSWRLVGSGNQDWRAVAVAFTQNALYWGTDAGSDAGSTPNFIMRFDRSSGDLVRVHRVQGPCHGVGALAGQTIVVSTGVEGGVNEVDRSAHLWAGVGGVGWCELGSRPRRWWPHIIQYGVMRIPPGVENCEHLDFTGLALQGASETWFRGKITSL